WDDCAKVLSRLNLRLPSEAEWEYAARAGTTTPWWTGDVKESLVGYANVADLYAKKHEGTSSAHHEEWMDDGYVAHAPLDALRPNPFGLHHIAGNVWEWCQDVYQKTFQQAPADGSAWELLSFSQARVIRGGGFSNDTRYCRSSCRNWNDQNGRYHGLGVRPACSVKAD
ncbi:MAG: formylglycine-generating enzyme family protein, partial [Planctomycetota bacterium]